MVVILVLGGLLVFCAYAGVTGRCAADSRDPEFGWRWSEPDKPVQQVSDGARQLAAEPGSGPVAGGPVVERTEVGVDDGPADLRGVGLVAELAG